MTTPRRSRRSFLRMAAGASALTMGALTGCGPLQAVAPTPTAVPVTTITVWNWVDDALNTLVQAFEERQPNIKVKLESVSYGQAHSRFAQALQSGSGAPDVFLTDLSALGGVRAQPGLADLSAAPFDGAALKADYLPWAWDLVSVEGRTVALPWVAGVGVAWYRADIFAAAGLPTEPEAVREQAATWDGWLALDEALRRKSPKAELTPESLRLFQPAVAQQGLGWLSGSQLLVEQKGLRAAELLAALHERDVPAELAGGEFARRVIDASYAGMVDASWQQLFLQREFRQTAGQWRIARAPGGDFVSGALFLCIPQQSPNQEAAWAFVRALCADAGVQNTAFQATGALPVNTAAWRDPLYDRPVEFFGGQPAYRLLTEAAQQIPPGAPSPYDQQIDQIVYDEARRVAASGKEPAQAMSDAAAAVRKRIPELGG